MHSIDLMQLPTHSHKQFSRNKDPNWYIYMSFFYTASNLLDCLLAIFWNLKHILFCKTHFMVHLIFYVLAHDFLRLFFYDSWLTQLIER